MIALVFSEIDEAGKGIATYIRDANRASEMKVPQSTEAYFLKDLNAYLLGFQADVVEFDFLDNIVPDVRFYIFLSRHSASSGIKSLTTHHTGNPTGNARFGGNPFELSISNPPLAWLFLKGLKERSESMGLKDFRVTYEVTHHGPTNLTKPLTFIEIGSSLAEWKFARAHEVVGDVVIDSLKNLLLGREVDCIPSTGYGGPHYADRFTYRALSLNECYGHIISRYALKDLKNSGKLLENVVRQSLLKSSVKIRRAVILKKVSAMIREKIEEVCRDLGVEVIKA